MIQRTLVIVKPDGVLRGLIGEVITRFEAKGLKVVAARLEKLSKKKAQEHYAEHKSKPFFKGLVDFITCAPVLLMVIEGNRSIESVRNLLGKTNGVEALPGTIRGDYGSSRVFNIVHASDSPASAKREINMYFNKSEIYPYRRLERELLFEEDE